eukprot:TRINITY_DN9547_c0_g1_i1.p1 TRINITY_DN9547_c0_g1~~TRINITY_DN9547_c0_g1_i1.p1  ORF type:complete len:211 (-),score=97.42 TRINITY_DN9547_c0_g1_i1:453-1085(-)
MSSRKPYKVLDRTRSVKKGVMAANLEELLGRGKEKLGYSTNTEVYAVLEEDGTEVDEDDYFQTLPNNTTLMLLYVGDRWSPFANPDAPDCGGEMTASSTARLIALLTRLESEPGCIALMAEVDLELLAEMDCNSLPPTFPRFDPEFLSQLQSAADKHLFEKSQIRDTLGLLKIYHRSSDAEAATEAKGRRDSVKADSPRKRHKANQDTVG